MATDKEAFAPGGAEHRTGSVGNPHDVPLDAVPKSLWERIWPSLACGAGLFSDGYLQG